MNGRWIAQWREDSRRLKRTLGVVSGMTKTEAQQALEQILAPINQGVGSPSTSDKLAHFIEGVVLPFYRRKWKLSTAITTENRLRKHSTRLREVIESWRETAIDTSPDAWVFPSETGRTPVQMENIFRRNFRSKLEAVGLGWVTLQVMRRTHVSLMRELDVDPKLVADQLGHTLDVSLYAYAKLGLERRIEAPELFESRLRGVASKAA